MGEWKTYRLGEICTTKGAQYSISEHWPIIQYLDTGNITYNKINDIQSIIIGKDTLPSRARKKVKKDDIIFSCVRPNQCHFGILTNPPDNLLVSTGFAVISVDKKFAVPHYVYYYITQDHIINYLQNIGEQAVSTYPTIKASDIENLKITLPPLEEQRRIAGILGSLDDKIELNRRINANLEAQAQALFRSWFVDFEPFRDGPFVDSELGKIPQGWKIGTLSEIGDVIGGGTPSKIKPEYYTDNGIAWITPKDLSTNNCKFTSKGETDISELGYKNSSAKLMPRGSVLFSSRAPIGYISIAKNGICTNQGFKSIVPKKAGTCFIYYFLRNNTSKIESMASGSTFKEASGGLMKSLEVIIPSNKILTAFEEAVQPLFNMQEHNEDENARLSALRDTLLPKLMAGEINLH